MKSENDFDVLFLRLRGNLRLIVQFASRAYLHRFNRANKLLYFVEQDVKAIRMKTKFYAIHIGFLVFLMSCFQLSVHAQTSTVKGRITDASSKEPLIGVNVLTENGEGSASDVDGKYEISTTPGEHTLVFRFVGYDSLVQKVNLVVGQTLVLDVSMKETNQELSAVVVSAGRYEQKLEEVTVSMSLIKPQLIDSKSTVNVETIMEQVPGVSMQDGQVSIRGGSGFAYGAGSRVLMLVDELPLLSADAGDVKWNTLPVENIEQIEVIKGASSVLFGSSALNGAINIRTSFPRDKPQTKITMVGGMYGTPARDTLKWWDGNRGFGSVGFFHSQKFGQFDLVLGANGFDDAGYREGEVERRTRFNFNTRYRFKNVPGLSLGVNGNYQLSKAGIFLIWAHADQAYQPFGGADPETDPESTISVNTGQRLNLDPYITYYTKSGARHSLRTRYYWVKNENATNQSSDAYLMYGEYQYSKRFRKDFNLTAGAASYKSRIVSELYGDHSGTNVAAFGQLDKKIGRWNLSGGIRFEYYKLDAEETISSIDIKTKKDTINIPIQPVMRFGANYKVNDGTYLRGSFGQGYRFPAVAEKYVSTSVGALNIFPNPKLLAETGWSAELGLRQGIKFGKWMGYADVAGFITQYENMVEFTFGIWNPDTVQLNLNPNHPNSIGRWSGFRAQNAPETARISGVDFSLVAKGKVGKKLEITIFAGYTYMNPKVISDTKTTKNLYDGDYDSVYVHSFSDTVNVLKYRVKHLGKADVQFDYGNWSLGISARYTSKMVNIDRTFEHLEVNLTGVVLDLGPYVLPGLPEYRDKINKDYVVMDARLAYSFSKWFKLNAVVNNVFNLEYMGRPGDIQAPRTYMLQATFSF
jgi:iron complex outermembrane receptor protein